MDEWDKWNEGCGTHFLYDFLYDLSISRLLNNMKFKNIKEKQTMIELALSAYIGEKCICGHKFKTLEEIKESVWHPHNNGRVSHRKCWDKHLKVEGIIARL